MRRRSPQEKKALEYEHAHFTYSERPHLFRRSWPRKKARVNRRDRRRGERLLEGLRNQPADAVAAYAEDAALTAEHASRAHPKGLLRKASLTFLRERVAERTAQRVSLTGISFFGHRYDSATDRKPFAAFLAALVAGSGPGSQARAAHFDRMLGPVLHDPLWGPAHERRREWLRAFFRDEPEWEPRLREWIERMLAEGE